MLIGDINTFLTAALSRTDITAPDSHFLKELETEFSSQPAASSLTPAQSEFLQTLFARRWQAVADTSKDYTFCETGINEDWMRLGLLLAAHTKKSIVQILIPVVTNVIDPLTLSRIADSHELRRFYLGADGQTLHRVRGLQHKLEKREPLATLSSIKSFRLRPLHLQELYRIRAKVGEDLQMHTGAKRYPNFWAYLRDEFLPEWQSRGHCPQPSLHSMRELIVDCFASPEADLTLMRKQLLDWANELQTCAIDDVNCLYSQVIPTSASGARTFVVDVLLDCLYGEIATMPAKLTQLGGWLCHYDPSLTLDTPAFDEVYQTYKLGRQFSMAQLLEMISALAEIDEESQAILAIFAARFAEKDVIDTSVITALQAIFSARWTRVMGTEKDYTRAQQGVNAPWIRLAQALSGASKLPRSYYHFLMPTLVDDCDAVTRGDLTQYHLSHYVLAEDGASLILLDNCAEHYRENGTFYNCNQHPPKPLTPLEFERVKYADKQFAKYIRPTGKAVIKEKPIGWKTIVAVKELVDNSLYPIGLMRFHSYNVSQLERAESAYHTFFRFVSGLPEEERQRLLSQRILFHRRDITVEKVINQIEKGECIAVYGQYFAQLVMDYAPYLRFRDELESSRRLSVNDMRARSRRKVPSEYELTNKEARKRIQQIILALMQHNFSTWPWDAVEARVGEYNNTLPREIFAVFTCLMEAIERRSDASPRAIYAEMMERLVKPALLQDSWSARLSRHRTTLEWLTCLRDAPTAIHTTPCYSLTQLIMGLTPLVDNVSLSPTALVYVDKLLKLYFQLDTVTTVDELRANLLFSSLLKELPPVLRTRICAGIKEDSNDGLGDVVFGQLVRHRVALLAAQVTRPGTSGLLSSKVVDASVYRAIITRLNSKVTGEALSDGKGLTEVLESIRRDLTLPESSRRRVRLFGESFIESSRIRSSDAVPEFTLVSPVHG